MQKDIEIPNADTAYNALVEQITEIVAQSRIRAVRAVNSELVATNWNIGRYIVEFEQKGNARAEYGKKLIPRLSKDLTLRLGTGYSRSNLANMRLLYLRFPIFQTVSGKFSWSMLVENLFVAKYKLYLPEVNELKALVLAEMDKLSKK